MRTKKLEVGALEPPRPPQIPGRLASQSNAEFSGVHR